MLINEKLVLEDRSMEDVVDNRKTRHYYGISWKKLKKLLRCSQYIYPSRQTTCLQNSDYSFFGAKEILLHSYLPKTTTINAQDSARL